MINSQNDSYPETITRSLSLSNEVS